MSYYNCIMDGINNLPESDQSSHEESSSSMVQPLQTNFNKISKGYLIQLKDQLFRKTEKDSVDRIISLITAESTLTKDDIKVVDHKLYLCGVHLRDGVSPTLNGQRNKPYLLRDPKNLKKFGYIDLFHSLIDFTNKISSKEFNSMGLNFDTGILSIDNKEFLNTLSELSEKNKEFLSNMKAILGERELMIPFAVNNGNSVVYCILQNGSQSFENKFHVSHLPQSSTL